MIVQTKLDKHNQIRPGDIRRTTPTLVYYLVTNSSVENEQYIGITYVHCLKSRLGQHRNGDNYHHIPWPDLELIKTEGPMMLKDAMRIERECIHEYERKGIPLANKIHRHIDY